MDETEVVVIGSGPCGATAAAELVRAGVDVVMLDAGRRPVRGALVRAHGHTLFRWADRGRLSWDRHVPTGDPTTVWGSSLNLGGLSNYWTSAVPRMHPDDFVDGAALDERFRWPIGYSDLEPFYELVEREMDITAGLPVRGVPSGYAAFETSLKGEWRDFVDRTAGRHAIGLIPMAKGRPWMAVLRPTAFTSYHCLVKPALSSPRFSLVTGARAVRLETTADHVAVEYADARTRALRRIVARRVVVAAGTLDSTALLLQSRSREYPDGLGNSNGLVGRYLHDHPRQWWPARLDRPMPPLVHPLYIPRSPVGSTPPLMATSLTLGFVGAPARIKSWCGGRSDLVGAQVFGTMVPREDSTVRLAGEDHYGGVDRRLEICIRYDKPTLQNVEAARDRFVDLFRDAGVGAEPIGPFHEIRPGWSFHYGGTVRMHSDPSFGVVDAWNRLHDAPNVIVCDASCFTTGPEKNPTLTAMAIAARAARRLASDLAGTQTVSASNSREVQY